MDSYIHECERFISESQKTTPQYRTKKQRRKLMRVIRTPISAHQDSTSHSSLQTSIKNDRLSRNPAYIRVRPELLPLALLAFANFALLAPTTEALVGPLALAALESVGRVGSWFFGFGLGGGALSRPRGLEFLVGATSRRSSLSTSLSYSTMTS